MRKLMVLAVLALSASLANADGIPIYNLTQGTVLLSNVTLAGFQSVFSFSNGNGASIGGVDDGFSLSSLVGGGGTGNPFLNIGLNLETSNVNGTTLFLFGLLSITGSNFSLPTSGTAFSITEPVLFSGSFLSCAGTFGSFGGCNPPPTYLREFNINGPGMVTLSFVGVPLQDGGVVWQLSAGKYQLSAVPEPATVVLLGTGALAILGKLRRRRRSEP
jgi:PEP-CTERM motif